MDNVTHSIVGLLLAQTVVQARAARGSVPSSGFATGAAIVSVVGNNLPDIDFVYSGITPGKLGYLLHHRGHTHTLVGALVGAALVLAVTAIIAKRRRSTASAGDWRWIFALSVISPLLHIGMDFLNNYGVHPFWPLDNGWYYGDSVFIIEPWLWVLSVPALVLTTRSWGLRVGLGLVLAVGLGLAWTIPFVPWGVAVALTLGSIGASVAAARLRARPRILSAAVACIVAILGFQLASAVARTRVERVAGEHLADAVMTPAPANPLCFSAILVDTPGSNYRLRMATIATLPSLLPASACRVEGWEASLSMSKLDRLEPDRSVRWVSEWAAPLEGLRSLAQQNCQAEAFLRFARAPYWFPVNDATVQIGDLRYDRGRDLEFAEVQVPREPEQCPPWLAPWEAPRADVLSRPRQ